jgi:hypothetical protein
MTTPIAERVAGPSHGRALSGDLSLYRTIANYDARHTTQTSPRY